MRRVKVAAVVIALIAVGVALTLPLRVENAQYASLSIEKSSQREKQQQPELIERPGKTDNMPVLVLPTFNDAVTVVDTVEYNRQRTAHRQALAQAKAYREKAAAKLIAQQQESVETSAKPNIQSKQNDNNNSGNYCLIVASLASLAEAEAYVAKSKDTNLSVLAKDGHYRVYALTGESVADVQAKSRTTGVSARYPDAWVCRR
jgi:septal ring-binding cell division protein DamX